MSATTPDVFTVTQLAERWGCHRQAVVDAIHAGKLRAFKLGKRWMRIARAEVERFEAGGAT